MGEESRPLSHPLFIRNDAVATCGCSSSSDIILYLTSTFTHPPYTFFPPVHIASYFSILNNNSSSYDLSGDYDCLDDELSSDPIGVSLYDEKQTPVWRSRSGDSEGSFYVRGSGKFELCIQNGNIGSDDYFGANDGKSREVGFAVRVTSSLRGMEDGKVGPDDRVTSNLLDMCGTLMRGLQTMEDHQEYMRERENRHLTLADATFHRVVQWTVLEAVVLVLIACGQVLYLKRFFEQTRYL